MTNILFSFFTLFSPSALIEKYNAPLLKTNLHILLLKETQTNICTSLANLDPNDEDSNWQLKAWTRAFNNPEKLILLLFRYHRHKKELGYCCKINKKTPQCIKDLRKKVVIKNLEYFNKPIYQGKYFPKLTYPESLILKKALHKLQENIETKSIYTTIDTPKKRMSNLKNYLVNPFIILSKNICKSLFTPIVSSIFNLVTLRYLTTPYSINTIVEIPLSETFDYLSPKIINENCLDHKKLLIPLKRVDGLQNEIFQIQKILDKSLLNKGT
jgi:hypothetical protein